MSRKEEEAYTAGCRAVYVHLLREALSNLGEPELGRSGWVVERAEAIAALRSLCAEFGDNDWPDSLHLADIIDKHLGRHLHRGRR